MVNELRIIEQHLRTHAGKYNPEWSGRANIDLVRHTQRAAARLYWFRIGGAATSQIVIAKVPGAPADATGVNGSPRPRLVEPPVLALKYAREHHALDLLQRTFSEGKDRRFGAVPLLDRVDAARAIVMGQAEGRPMTHMLLQLSRIYPAAPSRMLAAAVENAGAWLRAYHGLELNGTGTRQSRRTDFVELVQRYCDHLGLILSRRFWFDRLAARLTQAAERLLPERLPVGLAHGDFAMRNILVASDSRVTVLDTTALWAAPLYEDLAKFQLALEVSRAQTYSHGLAFSEQRLRTVHGWLLAGYYGGEPVPHQQIRVYALLLLLDKWAFELALPFVSPVKDALRRQRVNSWFTTLINRSAWLLD